MVDDNPDIVDRRQWVRAHAQTQDGPSWRRGVFGRRAQPAVHSEGWTDRHWSSRLLYRVGEYVAHSSAGVIAALALTAWVVVGFVDWFPSWWQTTMYSVTGGVTFVMVFVIQHSQARQTAATQRKLDELLRASAHADNTLIAIEEAPDEHLEARSRLNLADREAAAHQTGL